MFRITPDRLLRAGTLGLLIFLGSVYVITRNQTIRLEQFRLVMENDVLGATLMFVLVSGLLTGLAAAWTYYRTKRSSGVAPGFVSGFIAPIHLLAFVIAFILWNLAGIFNVIHYGVAGG